MGILNDDYYANLAKQRAQQPLPQAQSQQTAVATVEAEGPKTMDEMQSESLQRKTQEFLHPVATKNVPHPSQPLSEAEQIKRFGGVVGSPEYQKYIAEHPVRSFLGQSALGALGLPMPGNEEWDRFSNEQKTGYVTAAGFGTVVRMIAGLPKETLKVIPTLSITAAQGIKGALMGQGPADLANEPVTKLPYFGEVPTWFQTAGQARKAGFGPWSTAVLTATKAVGDVTIGALYKDFVGSIQPRARLVGKPTINANEVTAVMERDQTGAVIAQRRTAEGVGEYKSMPKEMAKKYGGNSENTFFKVVPSGVDGASVELSVVRVGKGKDASEGKFGPETKVYSEIIPVEKAITQEGKAPILKTEESRSLALSKIMEKPLKGFENKPITEEQTTHLGNLAEANGIESNMANAVVRVVTGKESVGSLTQAEYVKASQALGAFRSAAQNAGQAGNFFVNSFTQYLSPQRRWMRSIEEKYGIPLYTKVYTPIENAAKLRDIFRSERRAQIREIFGDYAKNKWGDERRLIKAYMEGNKGAITENTALAPEVKTDLIAISDKLSGLYDELGMKFGIPREVFLKNYQPHIQNLGGVYMLYKDATEIPKELTAFFEFKREGALTTQVDDALALADIYVNAGSNKMFFNPALEEVAKVSGGLTPSLAGSVKSYVGEKLGHAGAFERFLNEGFPRLIKNIPFADRWNFTSDLGRKFTSFLMDTTYAGALGGRPDAVVRNLLQNTLMTFPRLGGKFYADAVRKAMTPEGIAEVRKNGFLIEGGIPYGEEVARNAAGNRAGGLYQRATQTLLKPYGAADTFTRGATYWQARYIWEDALSRYSSGKLTWEQFEKAADFNALHVVDRNIIRDLIVKGDDTGAMNHFIRDIIDETQFPYRRGSSSRITYGLAGKLGTQFAQWNIEFLHTVGSWAKTGQWDKLIRFAGTAEATRRTIEDTFGIDVSKWTGAGAVGTTPSPFVQFGGEALDLLNNVRNNNAKLVNESWSSIARTVLALGIPGGVQGQRFLDFRRSIDLSEKYKLPDGQFGVYSKTGGLLYATDFNGIFWKMWGFPPKEGTEALDTSRRIQNALIDRTEAKRRAMEFLQEEKYDEASDILSKYQLEVTDQDREKYFIPIDQRNFYRLPPYLKAQFYNPVFNPKK